MSFVGTALVTFGVLNIKPNIGILGLLGVTVGTFLLFKMIEYGM